MLKNRLSKTSAALLAFSLLLLLAQVPSAQATSLYAETRERFGYGVSYRWGYNMDDFPLSIAALHAGWYTDFMWQVSPTIPDGMEYVQVLPVRDPFTNWTGLAAAVAANPGAIWIVGNEPDRQEPLHPQVYVQRYHEFYTFIKGLDSTARLANAPLVQGTPLRMRYLDDVFNEYAALYGETMPVDVWTTHEQILREDYPITWGCSVPQAYIPRLYNGTIYSVPRPIYCDITSTGQVEYCQYDEEANLLPGQTWTQGAAYVATDNANPVLFVEHIERFRQWMKDNGQQEKPLMITEYGVLFPSVYFPDGDDAVLDFMDATFRYLLSATDEDLGYSADGYRLVQRWNWFGLNIHPDPAVGGYNGALAQWDSDVLTVFGDLYATFTNNADPQTGTASPTGGVFQSGAPQTITTTFSDADGVADLDQVYLMIGLTESQKNTIYLRYDPDTNRVYLRNADDSAWMPSGGLLAGAVGTAENTLVILDAQQCSATTDGNTLTVNWGLNFKAPMVGTVYTQYLKAGDEMGAFDGWDAAGLFGIGQFSPETLGVSPSSGDLSPGGPLPFQTSYSDFNGADTITSAYFLLNTTLSESDGVYLRYDPGTGLLYLRNLENTAWLPAGGVAVGSTESVGNSLAILRPDLCQVSLVGDTLAVTWTLELQVGTLGQDYGEYLKVVDGDGLVDGWDLWGSIHVRDVQMETVQIAPNSGWSEPGTPLLFTTTYWHKEGPDNIDYAELLINGAATTSFCVYLRYDAQDDRLWIRLPGDDGWRGGLAPGTIATARTTWVTLDFGQTVVQRNGSTLTVTWAFTPSYKMSGRAHNTYLRMADIGGLVEGWNDEGDWIINRRPTNLKPDYLVEFSTIVAGVKETFNPRYKDLDGRPNLTTTYFAIADSLPSDQVEMMPGGVFFKYDLLENKMYLANWEGTSWGEGVTPGTAGALLENKAVTVIVQFSTIGTSGAKAWIVRYRLAFKTDFVGKHKAYMRCIDVLPQAGGDTGWNYKGVLEVLAP